MVRRGCGTMAARPRIAGEVAGSIPGSPRKPLPIGTIRVKNVRSHSLRENLVVAKKQKTVRTQELRGTSLTLGTLEFCLFHGE